MKIKLKSTLYFEFWLYIWSRNSHWNKTQKFHIINYNTIIFARRAMKLKLKFFQYLEGSRVLDKEKNSVHNSV